MVWLLIGYMFLFIYRPFEVWPALGEFRIELLFMLLTGTVWLAHPHKRIDWNPLHLAIGAFAAAMLLCSLLSSHFEICLDRIDVYFKVLVFYLILVTAVHQEQDLRRLVLAFLVVMAIYQAHSLYEFLCGRAIWRMGISRMSGIDSSFSDPNAFSNSVLLSLPFALVVWSTRPTPWARPFVFGYVLLSIICISRTGSRTAFVGLALLACIEGYRSRHRWLMLPVLVALSPLLWMALPEQLQNRFTTIIDPSVGPANAQVSAEGRLVGLEMGYQLWQNNVLTGVGPGAWRPATKRQLESHNLYGQLMGEMGTLGIITFLGILLAFAKNLWDVRAGYLRHPEWDSDFLRQCSGAIGVGVFLLLLSGCSGHNLFRYQWPWFAAILTIVHRCVRQREAESRQAPDPAPEYAGWGRFSWEGS